MSLSQFYHFCSQLGLPCDITVANLFREIIMVRDNLLTIPGWFTRDDINDIISSVCMFREQRV